MSLSLFKVAALSGLLISASAVPAFAADSIQEWADVVRQEFASKQRYPSRAKQANEEGTVKVRVRVSPNGAVNGFEILKSSGSELLDAEAIDLIARVDPLPAVPGGKDGYAFTIPLSFKLKDAGTAFDQVEFERDTTDMLSWSKAASRQILDHQTYPDYLINRGVEGSVKLRVDVASNGLVTDAQLLKSSGNEELDEEALLMAGDLHLPRLPEGVVNYSIVLPLKYKIAEERTIFARR